MPWPLGNHEFDWGQTFSNPLFRRFLSSGFGKRLQTRGAAHPGGKTLCYAEKETGPNRGNRQ